eukprot:c21233_g1_i1 orf=131-529(+)
MAGQKITWAQMVSSRSKLLTPYKETYHRKKGETDLLSYIMRLEQSIQNLQQKTEDLQQQNQELQNKVNKLERAADKKAQQQEKQALVKEVIQECISPPHEELVEFVEKTVSQHRPAQAKTDLKSEIQQQIKI